MISVIVPTMWRYAPFVNFYLNEIVKVPEVGEIIIINNDKSNTPPNPILRHEKVKVIDQEKNIFVNPAWNLGVEVSRNEKLCFLNDDAMVDLRLFSLMDNWLTDQIGAAGIVEYLEGIDQPPFRDGSIDLILRTVENCYGFGVLFFIHKNNWIPIPLELEVAYGDVWVFESQLFLQKKPNYLISNVYFHHAGSITGNQLPRDGLTERFEKESVAYRYHAHKTWGALL